MKTREKLQTAVSAVRKMLGGDDFYAKLRAQSERMSGVLLRGNNLMVGIGCLMYVSYVVLSLKLYWPSFLACMRVQGDTWFALNCIMQSVFLITLLLHLLSGVLPAKTVESYYPYVGGTMCFCVVYFVLVFGMFYMQCSNRRCTLGEEQCDVEELTKFNTTTLLTLNLDARIDLLQQYFMANMRNRISIADCPMYYNGFFLREATVDNDHEHYDNLEHGLCDPDATAEVYCNHCKIAGDGSPILAEFFVMASARTCCVGEQYDDYVSPRMIQVALVAGARCLDFDVSSYGYAIDAPPIVSLFRDRDNVNLMRNFVLLETCFRTIMDWRTRDANKRDPLFIRLNFRRALTPHIMKKIADMIFYYFNEMNGRYLLGSGVEERLSKWNYQDNAYGSLAKTPICLLFGKIVIMVHSPFRKPPDRLMELVNVYSGPQAGKHANDCKVMDWKQVTNFSNKALLRRRNKHHLTYVETTYVPYSDVSPILAPGEGGLVGDPSAKYTKDDSFTSLLMNRQTINNDPVVSLKCGCQFVAMNFQNLDADMHLYLSMFYRSSLMLKPFDMRRRIPVKIKLPVVTPCSEDKVIFELRDSEEHCKGFEITCLTKEDADDQEVLEFLREKGFVRRDAKEKTCYGINYDNDLINKTKENIVECSNKEEEMELRIKQESQKALKIQRENNTDLELVVTRWKYHCVPKALTKPGT